MDLWQMSCCRKKFVGSAAKLLEALIQAWSVRLRPLPRNIAKHGSRGLATPGLRMNQHVASFGFRCC